MYSKEDLEEIDKRLKKVSEEARAENDKFWKEEYPNKSREEKVMYWLASTHKGMRTQGEIGESEYSEFSFKWYERVKSVESDFDEIFKEVVTKLGFEFDWGEYRKRIKI